MRIEQKLHAGGTKVACASSESCMRIEIWLLSNKKALSAGTLKAFRGKCPTFGILAGFSKG